MAEMNPQITGVILAGGQSRRFGSNKALINWDNGRTTLIETVLNTFKSLFLNNLILVKDRDEYLFLNSAKTSLVVEDILKEFHPLGGIYTALNTATTEYIFVCGCDMPFIKPELIEDLQKAAYGYDAVIPYFNDKLQPLCGIYSKKCLKSIKKMIDENRLKILDLFGMVNTRFFNEEEVKQIDPEGQSFLDIDTIEDYKQAINFPF